VVWGANFAVTKYVLDAIGVAPFLFIRFLALPLLGFALLALVYRRHLAKSVPRRGDWARFAAAGLIGHTLHVGIVTWGIDLSTAFSSSLVLTSGPLFTLPAFLAAPLAQVPAGVWLGVVWAVGVSSFLGWLVWSWVNAVRGLARSAPLQYLMPPISGVVAWWMLGEQFTALKLAGAALTMAGVAWAQFGGRKAGAASGPPDPG
jgi:drug/metabolite transporter (DMT)-like permease